MNNMFVFNEMHLESSKCLDADLLQLQCFRSTWSEYVLGKKTSLVVKAGHPIHNGGLLVMGGVAMMPEFGLSMLGWRTPVGRPHKLPIRLNGDRPEEWFQSSNHKPPASITSHVPTPE